MSDYPCLTPEGRANRDPMAQREISDLNKHRQLMQHVHLFVQNNNSPFHVESLI